MRLLITGGAGFIGSNLARFIQANRSGYEVIVLDNLSTGSIENLAGVDVEFVEGSLLNAGLVASLVERVDSVIHLGAIPSVPRSIADPMSSHHVNTTGTLNVLEAARRNGTHVVLASSSSVYGSNPKLPKNELDWTRPLSPYAVSKLATEAYALAYQSSYGVPTLPFRFFNVFGPGQSSAHAYAAVVPAFLDAALHGRPLPVNGDGRQSRDFTFVGTVAAVLLRAAERRETSLQPVNLAFGTNTTLLALIAEIESILGEPLAIEYHNDRIGDVRASQADSTEVRKMFDEIDPVSLRDGIEQTLAWFRSRGITAA